MPEYLAPAVYIEEIPSGNKPIEGASTSTAGMVGFTQRGPENTPTLVTSFGAFNRVFGGFIDYNALADPTSGLDALPYAAQGLFANGGSRLYVTRILGAAATTSSAVLYGADPSIPATPALSERAAAGDAQIVIDDGAGIISGTEILISDGDRTEVVTASGPATQTRLSFNAALGAAHADNATVQVQVVTPTGTTLSANGDLAAGDTALAVDDASGLAASDIVRITDTGDPGVTEFVTVTAAGQPNIVPALLFSHPAATTQLEVVTLAAGAASTLLDGATVIGDTGADVDPNTNIAVDDVVSVDGELRIVTAAPEVVLLTGTLTFNHAAGVSATASVPMLEAHARYRGRWGDSVRVRAVSSSLLESTMTAEVGVGDTIVTLSSAFGLYEGSVLEFDSGERRVVSSVDRTSGEVELASGLGATVAAGSAVVSIEFDLIVERLETGKVAESEAFEKLAMNATHPRYAPRIIGVFDRTAPAGQESAPSGESELVRLSDRTLDDLGNDEATAASARIAAPDTSVSVALAGGVDDDASIGPDTFIGNASDDPEDRTGIQALENETSLSILAVPGQTEVAVQKALLTHCEKMRYRFAVLEPPQGAKLADARGHRQNFDNTRGAVYYPWLVIPDRFGERGDLYKIPPSGHVLGIYARTDVQRGVWKAPANEVVRGVLSFETALTKGEQDILNPNHVNCFRDFRTANRGLRLWGARTLSSDPEWKYVNVRRLFLFVEQSLDNGLQFAVFEPNAEPLWATVKQSISNFLATIWRDGGLEGTSEEEAFFVNVGFNVTMTQADIDNGRMIVEVGIAPVKPAEFVIIRISQKTREATS